MASLRVFIQDHTQSKKTLVELPDDIPMQRLLPVLAARMQLPLQQGGNPIIYRLDHRRTGRRLDDEDTLHNAQVKADDLLTLLPEVTAGGVAPMPRPRNVREIRLQSDWKKLEDLAKHSHLIRLGATQGFPPESYEVRFSCRGIVRLDPAGPVYGEEHRVRIDLPAEYPIKAPNMRWLTPIFHPNINAEGTWVCISEWYPGKFLDDLCIMLGRMIQYKNYNPHSPLNRGAALWALENPRLLPVDRRPLRDGETVGRELDEEFEIRLL